MRGSHRKDSRRHNENAKPAPKFIYREDSNAFVQHRFAEIDMLEKVCFGTFQRVLATMTNLGGGVMFRMVLLFSAGICDKESLIVMLQQHSRLTGNCSCQAGEWQ